MTRAIARVEFAMWLTLMRTAVRALNLWARVRA